MQIGLGLIASLALNSFPVAVSEAVCNEPHNGELFLHTLDEFIPRFRTTPIYGQLQKVQDFFVAEEGNRRPIALVMFGSSGVVHMVVELLADCFYGVQRGDFVSKINVKDVLQQSVHAENKTIDFDAARRLFKTRIKKAVASCPQRTVILLESVHTLTGELVRLLDVLLDPLNHERPLLDGVDCGGALVVLLMEGVPVLSTWRDTLEAQWSYKGEGFSPSAMIGRMTGAVIFGDIDADDIAKLSGIYFETRIQILSLSKNPSQFFCLCVAGLAILVAVLWRQWEGPSRGRGLVEVGGAPMPPGVPKRKDL